MSNGRQVPPHASGGGSRECSYCTWRRMRLTRPGADLLPIDATRHGVERWEVVDGSGRTGTILHGPVDHCRCVEYGLATEGGER